MGIVSLILLGLIAGALAKWIMPGTGPGGLFVTMLLGIGGAFLGGFVASVAGLGSVTGVNLWSILIGTLGALALLFIYREVKR